MAQHLEYAQLPGLSLGMKCDCLKQVLLITLVLKEVLIFLWTIRLKRTWQSWVVHPHFQRIDRIMRHVGWRPGEPAPTMDRRRCELLP
jgi:hypothetical protein